MIKKSKPLKKTGEAHSMNQKIGHGTYQGSGIRNPMGKMRESFMDIQAPKSTMKKPPKTLA